MLVVLTLLWVIVAAPGLSSAELRLPADEPPTLPPVQIVLLVDESGSLTADGGRPGEGGGPDHRPRSGGPGHHGLGGRVRQFRRLARAAKIVFLVTDGNLDVQDSPAYGRDLGPESRDQAARDQIPGVLAGLRKVNAQVWPLGGSPLRGVGVTIGWDPAVSRLEWLGGVRDGTDARPPGRVASAGSG
ncbi:MAG: hypothetical protein ACRDSR_20700 [Pseudonocardiaceae bacterium]